MKNNKRKYTNICLFIGNIFLSFLISMQSIFFPLSQRCDFGDSAIYQYIGHSIVSGKTPYLDIFDHKGIYFYFINSVGYLINPRWGMWVLIWFFMFGNILLIYNICRKFLEVKFSILITLIIGTGIGTNFWDGDTPDFFAVFFVLISFYELADYFINETLTEKNIIIVSITSAVAFWMKPNMIVGILIVCICLLIFFYLKKKFYLIKKSIAIFTVGFLVSSLPAIVWLYSRGAFQAMIEDYFIFNFVYSSFEANWSTRLSAFSTFMSIPSINIVMLCFLIILISMLLTAENKEKQDDKKLLICGSTSFAICMVLVVMPGNQYPQYTMLLYPSIIYILIGTVLHIKQCSRYKRKLTICAMIITCLIIFSASNRAYQYCQYFWKKVPQENDEIEYVVKNTSENDTISVISPYFSGFYIATNRESATKYAYIQANHFINANNRSETEKKFWKEYVHLLQKTQPRIILFDKDYYGNDAIMKVLHACLSKYANGGESARFVFYILPRSNKEEIPKFESDEQVKETGLKIEITDEMKKKYKAGEIALEDFLNLYDNQLENERSD